VAERRACHDRLFERFGTDKHVAALTEGRNFRYDVDPTYKGNRAQTRKPLAFSRVREEMEKQYNVVKFEGIEADDILGIFATRDPNTIVCRGQGPQDHPVHAVEREGNAEDDEAEADYWFFYQTLVGDTADGYPGCPGVGRRR
jgi:5'-3' exonuclease